MFTRKCTQCGRKLGKDFDFCPYCGNDFRWQRRQMEKEKYGLLGKDDSSMPDFGAMPFGLGSLFNSGLFNNLLKEVERQFKEMDREINKPNKRVPNGISISISTANGKSPEIKISNSGRGFNKIQRIAEMKIENPKISAEEAKKFAGLPKREAKTEVRRMSNKLIYEIALPGIKSMKDIVINKLENSIEIKAFSKENVYFKLLPVNLPILSYRLEDEKLILELAAK